MLVLFAFVYMKLYYVKNNQKGKKIFSNGILCEDTKVIKSRRSLIKRLGCHSESCRALAQHAPGHGLHLQSKAEYEGVGD